MRNQTKSGDEKHPKITFAVIEKMHFSDYSEGMRGRILRLAISLKRRTWKLGTMRY
jgi:hypothetical protein